MYCLLQPINLTVSSTNGKVNKNTVEFEDTTTFYPKQAGNASVTASVGNIYDTITITVDKDNPDLNVTIDTQEITYGEKATIALDYNPNATGTVNITLTGENQNYTFTNVDLSKTITISELLMADKYAVSIEYSGDDLFTNATAKADEILTVKKIKPNLTVDVNDIDYGDTEVITITSDAPGSVNITVNGKTETLNLNGENKEILFASRDSVLKSNNKATLSLNNLNAGDYPVEVAYDGDEIYENVNSTAKFKVNPIKTNIEVDSHDIHVGDDEIITIDLGHDNTQGTVTLEVDGKKYTAPVKNGKADVTVPNLSAGEKTATASYSRDGNYNPCENTTSFTVSKIKPEVSADAPDTTVGEKGHIEVNLPSDATGTVTITVNGKTYTALVENGKAIFDIAGLVAGTHNIEVSYTGDGKYEPAQLNTTITVNEKQENNTGKNTTVKNKEIIKLDPKETTGNPILVLLIMILTVVAVTFKIRK